MPPTGWCICGRLMVQFFCAGNELLDESKINLVFNSGNAII
jgi:hypothetical protein